MTGGSGASEDGAQGATGASAREQLPGAGSVADAGTTMDRSARRGGRTAGGLVVGAVVVVGLSLASGAEQEAVTVPGAGSSVAEQEEDDRGPRLGPEGLALLELGGPIDPEVWSTTFEQGCNRGLGGLTSELWRLGVGTGITVEADGDEVVAITLVGRRSSVDAPGTLPDVWLGPTLGDPIADAVALSGADVITEDPRGDEGPGVTSVVVDTDDGQVVFADPPYDQATPSEGRISQITVRRGSEPRCRLFDAALQLQPGEAADPDAPIATLDTSGTADVRLGDAVADAERAGLLLPQASPPEPGAVPDRFVGCSAWSTTDGTSTIVLADEAGEVVAVGSGGFGIGFDTTFGLTPGQRTEEASALLGAEPPPTGLNPESAAVGVAVEGEVAPGVRATIVSHPQWLPIETIDAVLAGPLRVSRVTVHRPGDGSTPAC